MSVRFLCYVVRSGVTIACGGSGAVGEVNSGAWLLMVAGTSVYKFGLSANIGYISYAWVDCMQVCRV